MDALKELLTQAITKQLDLRKDRYWENQIPERCVPVLWFGNHNKEKLVATLGANPSRLEFFPSREAADLKQYLPKYSERFYVFTKEDLNRPLTEEVLNKIILSYDRYFSSNPYTRWFGKPSTTGAYNLEGFLNGYGASFYNSKNLGCVHLDLMPFTTIEDFSKLNENKLKQSLYNDKWAVQSLTKLLELLKPQRLFVLGNTNTTWFNRFYYPLNLDKVYTNGPIKVRCGNSSIKLKSQVIPVTGFSLNLGNPRYFSKEDLKKFGAHFKDES